MKSKKQIVLLDLGTSNAHIIEFFQGSIDGIKRKEFANKEFQAYRFISSYADAEIYCNKDIKGSIYVDEIVAIGRGGLRVSKEDTGLVISCGTGICLVDADQKKSSYTHISGSPIGGGTLSGLGRLILGYDIKKVLDSARQGNAKNIDFSLRDILTKDLGYLNEGSTISHFGKIKNKAGYKKQDIARALVEMVSINIANLSVLGSRITKRKRLVLVGKMIESGLIKNTIKKRIDMIDKSLKLLFPKDPAFATAYGIGEKNHI
jgi:type II pantothenate kinase